MTNERSAISNTICSAVDFSSNCGAVLGAVAMVAILVLTMSEILSRFFFGFGFKFSWEFAGYAMAAAFFLPAAYTLRHGAHVRTSAVAAFASPQIVQWADRVCYLIGFAILLFATWAMGGSAVYSFKTGAYSWTGTGMPLWLPQGVIAIGLLLFALQCFAELIRSTNDRTTSVSDQLAVSEGL